MEIPFVVQTWARYSHTANRNLEYCLGAVAHRWEEPCGSYFGTLRALLDHVVSADCRWLRRLADQGWGPAAWATKAVALPVPSPQTPTFATWQEYVDLRCRIDALWMELTEALDQTALDLPFTYTNIQNEELTVPRAGMLFHLFNHQTHHRGAVSLILDSWGVANDFSGLAKSFRVG